MLLDAQKDNPGTLDGFLRRLYRRCNHEVRQASPLKIGGIPQLTLHFGGEAGFKAGGTGC